MVTNAPHPMATIRREHRLLAILRSLVGEHGPTSNSEAMAEWLGRVGLGCGHRLLEEELTQLANWGLVRLKCRDRLTVFGITRDGREVAEGVTSRDGIARFTSECPYD